MDYKLHNLKNNLKLLTVPMPQLESATVTVWVKTGSRNEPGGKLGLSHFLEHMAFKGGKKYPNAKAVSEAIDEVGGEFNASTSKEITQFYIRIRSSLLEKAFDVLSDIVIHPNLDAKEITKEKGVILEEMNMYEDTPVRRIWDIFEQIIFKGHPLGRDIIGTKGTVPNLQRSDFTAYREKYYKTQNMLISVAGGIKENSVLKLANKYFSELPKGTVDFEKGKIEKDNSRIKLVYKKVEQAHIILGFPADKLGEKDRYNDAIMDSVLGSGMSSRLFTEVREKRGLAYSVRSDFDRFADTGYFAVYAGVDPKKASEAIKVILDQFDGLSSSKLKVSAKELTKAKEYLKGHIALSLEDTRGVSSFFGYEQIMLSKVKTPEEVFDNIDKVSEDGVYSSAKKILDLSKLKVAIIGPYKKDTIFNNLLT